MDCICDCGAMWKADRDERQCALCRALDDAMYANVPPDALSGERPRMRRPPRPGEGGIVPSGQPLPELDAHVFRHSEPVSVCRCGARMTEGSAIGHLTMQPVCLDCAKVEGAEYLRRVAARPQKRAS